MIDRKMSCSDSDNNEINILVVEDDPVCYLLIEELLSPFSMNLYQAISGKEAWNLLNSKLIFKLVLMDIRLKGELNGYDMSSEIKQRFPDLKIIIQSAIVDMKNGVDSIPGVYDGFITKPFDVDLFSDTILSVLGISKSKNG
jgi:DNA-binding NtrC family response regulator